MDDEAKVAGVAAAFDTLASDYDAVGVDFFRPIAAGLVDALDPRPGERVADLGAGAGAATLPLARAVGITGQVDAVDIAPAMVARLARAAREDGWGNVAASVMDVREPTLAPGAYDVVASSLVLFFLPDPLAALRSWAALLRPGGRLGVATFGPAHPVWRHVDEVFEPYLGAAELDARTSGATGPFGSDEAMESLLATAGFDDVRTVGLDLPVRFADIDQWRAFSLATGQRRMWSLVPASDVPDLIAEAERRFAAARDADGSIVVGQHVRYTLGVRPV